MSESREFVNNFPDYSPESPKNLSEFNKQLTASVKKLLNNLETHLETETDWRDYSVYTGTSGIALLYLHLSRALESDYSHECLHKALPYVEHPLNHLRGHRLSFLCGDAGPIALASVLYHKTGRTGQAQELLKKLQNLKKDAVDLKSDLPDELLNGRVGYLFSLMFVQKHMGEACIDKSIIKNVAEAVLKSGQDLSQKEGHKSPLMYKWHDKCYLGAAHGICGILYMLMQARDYLSRSHMEQLVRPTVDYLMTLKFPSGNYPSSLGSATDKLVHWCHGAPGFIHMLVSAHQTFGGEKYLNGAKECGEVIWKRGILKKGYGICHGTAGNAYAFLVLFRVTKEPKYLHRAMQFAEWCFDYGKHGCRIADRPYSLYEGLAGTIYFLSDLLKPEKSAFPAFQLW